MSFKSFEKKDLVYNTVLTKPEINYIVHSGSVYYQEEKNLQGDFSNTIKHISQGEVSLHELNINRPSGSMVHGFIEKTSTRHAYRTVSTSQFDDLSMFAYGSTMTQSYPVTSSLSRIYIPSGPIFSSSLGLPHSNKKYIVALNNPLKTQVPFNYHNNYDQIKQSELNLICIPGIVYGSKLERGTINLKYHLTGALLAEAADIKKDGRLIQTSGSTSGQTVGTILYNQGIIMLHSSSSLHSSYTDYFYSNSSLSSPSWNNFGTGVRQVGTAIAHKNIASSSYTITANGVNKIPSLTMYAYAEKSEENYSLNPTYLEYLSSSNYSFSGSHYVERRRNIKKINKSLYKEYEEEYDGETYISKVGIYDKNKNLIAVVSLANPIKKVEKKDFMIKMSIDL